VVIEFNKPPCKTPETETFFHSTRERRLGIIRPLIFKQFFNNPMHIERRSQ
jgi:hypothetical protein